MEFGNLISTVYNNFQIIKKFLKQYFNEKEIGAINSLANNVCKQDILTVCRPI